MKTELTKQALGSQLRQVLSYCIDRGFLTGWSASGNSGRLLYTLAFPNGHVNQYTPGELTVLLEVYEAAEKS